MRPPRIIMGALCLACLLSGCQTHYTRTQAGQTTLFLRAPDAKAVVLFSSLDGFTPHAARTIQGKWANTLPGTDGSAREFYYFYRVDGELFIPDCRYKEKDDFGQDNCVYLPER